MLASASEAPPAPAVPSFYIGEYRVRGARLLPPQEVEEAVYPFLGPARTVQDVESARAALEKAYHEKGYQTVSVSIPPQGGRGGIVALEVTEAPVGRLRVHGSRYFDLPAIKQRVPSLAEGSVPGFNQLTREIVQLNRWPDRRVTPALRAGAVPGTVDIDLNVEDTFPLHGSLELNNRYSANTTPLRVSASATYTNLWQLGHALSFSYETAPLRRADSEIFNASYLLRFPAVDGLTLVLQGTKQNSDVTSTTVGSFNVISPGHVLGFRANFALPQGQAYSHNLSFGGDYKHFDGGQTISEVFMPKAISYYVASLAYAGAWTGPGFTTDISLGLGFGFRGIGSRRADFERKRVTADANFFILRGDLSHEQSLPGGLQAFARVHGQLADQALVNSEQIAGGGLDTVRGYLEAETLTDNGIFGTLELRSPSLLSGWKRKETDWRFYLFGDIGYLTNRNPLPEQDYRFTLASLGAGTRLNLLEHFHGSLDAGFPLVDQSPTHAGDWRLTFRLWADF